MRYLKVSFSDGSQWAIPEMIIRALMLKQREKDLNKTAVVTGVMKAPAEELLQFTQGQCWQRMKNHAIRLDRGRITANLILEWPNCAMEWMDHKEMARWSA